MDRLRFKEMVMQARIKLGGTDFLPAGTWIGWNGREWVRAQGEVRPELLIVSPGYAGEMVDACRQASVVAENMPPVGVEIFWSGEGYSFLHGWRVGRVLSKDTIHLTYDGGPPWNWDTVTTG